MIKGSRAIVAAFHTSLDGYMQGAEGEVDWVNAWNAARDLIADVDTCILGGGMYPGYERLWGSVAADPQTGTSMLGRPPSDDEVEYARWAQTTPHYVVSTTLTKVNWEKARLVRDVGDLRSLKEQPGGSIYVVGGASLVTTLLCEGLIDELRLIVHPVILGGGKSPFAGVSIRKNLRLVRSQEGQSGQVVLMYQT